MKTLGMLAMACAIALGAAFRPADAATEEDDLGAAAPGETAERQSQRLLSRAMALMDDRQEERAVRILTAIPLNFPKSPLRHSALLLLAKYNSGRGEYQLAIKNVSGIVDAEDAEPDQRAEALYRMGICHYGDSDHSRALVTLRRLTEQYPWSVFANEAYYYIGLCHFQLKRWSKAVEALKMVGTSVPPNEETESLVEAGQRFLVKVHDKDLRALKPTAEPLKVAVTTASGDSEALPLSVFDSEGEYYLGNIKMVSGAAVPNDGQLQFKGPDKISVLYMDAETLEGKTLVKRLALSRVVSSAVAGFMDGAFREYVNGVFAGQKTFVRVKDFDADVSDARDQVKVRIRAEYKPATETEEEAPKAAAIDAPAEETPVVVRDAVELALKETEPHSGLFAATFVIDEAKRGEAVNKADGRLQAVEKDTVALEYVDREHIGGLDDARTLTAKAEFLTGQIPDVWVAHREVNTEELRARKNLIEAEFYLRLAEIFRDVGLTRRAEDKADIGLEKVDDLLRRSLKLNIRQDLVEEAYRAKWELMLVKGDLAGAIAACRTLMVLYPTSSLADLALMQIAKANIEAEKPEEAMQILRGILGLQSANDLKAEAQYLIGRLLEAQGAEKSAGDRLSAMGPAIEAYRTCAARYPDSPFAGESLGKVLDFHLEAKDYERCSEVLQTVFIDYPDAPFLDEMLLKWSVVLVRQERYEEAREKLRQLLRDYPNSSAAGKAQKIIEVVSKRI